MIINKHNDNVYLAWKGKVVNFYFRNLSLLILIIHV